MNENPVRCTQCGRVLRRVVEGDQRCYACRRGRGKRGVTCRTCGKLTFSSLPGEMQCGRCRARANPGDPTPLQIKLRARRIRDGWDEATHRKRAGLPERPRWVELLPVSERTFEERAA